MFNYMHKGVNEMVYVYPGVFHPNEDGSITVTFPDLPGCVTEGKGIADALYMARDALSLWLDTTELVGDPIPLASSMGDVQTVAGEFVSLVDADTAAYKRQRQSKAVKRTISLPEWMDIRAAEENISLSKELQSALAARFDSEAK